MATFTADPSLIKQPRFLHEGMVHAYASYSASASLVTNDVIQMIQVPKGAVIHDLIMSSDLVGLTGTTTYVATVGDGGDAARYLSGSAVSAVIAGMNKADLAPVFRMTEPPGYQYTVNDTIDITHITPGGLDTTTASMVLKLSVIYSCSGADNEGLAGGT